MPPQSVARCQPSPCAAVLQELEPLLALSTDAPARRPQRGPPHAPADNLALGMLWYACSSFFFAGMGACSKALGSAGYVVWQITFVRAVIIMSCCLWVLIRDGAPLICLGSLQTMQGSLETPAQQH